ncbi:hypothetical protein [Aquisphaera insulae]|uniref:hypothetical protein n=1 Tax=Aquisphaera insulae TaxID=2712864 RepID=UPI0013ED9E06|nr:hypothetical protein [Aquisphaera insulae]
MPGSRRQLRHALGLVAWLSLGLGLSGAARAQVGPTYSGLFDDPPRTDRLAPADLANLGRLVVLEATSMYDHARSEFLNSPAGPPLLAEIQEVWRAGDDFTAAIAFSPDRPSGLEAGRLAYPALEQAYARLRDRMDNTPGGGSSRSRRNFLQMTRVIAVIPPLLASSPEPQPVAVAATDRARVDETARVLAQETRSLLAALEADATTPEGPKRDVRRLGELAEGFARIAAAGADDSTVVAGLRPLADVAGSLDLEFQRPAFAAGVRERWRRVRRTVDSLAARFRLPRQIVLARPRQDVPLEGAVAPIDEAIRRLEGWIGNDPAASRAVPVAEVPRDAAGRLLARLLLLRQDVIGGQPAAVIGSDLDGVETARVPLRPDVVGRGLRPEAVALDQSLGRAAAALRTPPGRKDAR